LRISAEHADRQGFREKSNDSFIATTLINSDPA
jgi:hypothetical protein